jgi:hypothetical protein
MFYWTSSSEREYHSLRSCNWLSVELWRGAQMVESVTPPADAAELVVVPQPWPESLRERVRWLCRVCALYMPDSRPFDMDRELEPCAKCTCSREMHEIWGGPFGCGMAWAEVWGLADDSLAMLKCRCDGYVPYRPQNNRA